MRIALLGCGRVKRAHPAPARELYCGSLFRAARDHVEARGMPWAILSGLHGLVMPDQVLGPYEGRLPRRVAAAWWDRLNAAVRRWRVSQGQPVTVIELHMGRRYAELARTCLVSPYGPAIEEPLAGLTVGGRLHWYAQRRAANDHPPGPVLAVGSSDGAGPGAVVLSEMSEVSCPLD